MEFDALVASVVPLAVVEDVKLILIAVGFTTILSSQAWDPGCRRGRRVVGLVWAGSFGFWFGST